MKEVQIPASWLLVARTSWIALLLVLLVLFTLSVPPYFDELRAACAGQDCPELALSPQESRMLGELGIPLELYAGYQVGLEVFFSVFVIPLAGLIIWRRPDSLMGFVLSLTLLLFGTVTSASFELFGNLYPGLRWPILFLDSIAGLLFVLLFYIFPDGRFVPRWTWVIVIGLAAFFLVNFLLTIRSSLIASFYAAGSIVWLVCLIAGFVVQVYRYRRVSTPTQRQQTKWVMFGLAITVLNTFVWSLSVEIFPIQPGYVRLVYNLSRGIQVLLFIIFPLSVAISILRYRLWDIDIFINRTIVYGFLTVSLAVLYFASVVLLQSISRALTGQGSPLTVVASTLAIAALFTPLRRRIQEGIDRRFYRQKYDARQVMAQFATTVRDEIDLDRLAQALLRTVTETTQPESVTLWLKQVE